jgi:hypothetical protein
MLEPSDGKKGGWQLALAFDGKHPEFLRGFEAGDIYRALLDNPDPLDTWVLASNAEMMLRIAEATNRTLSAQELKQHPENQPRLEVSFGPSET